MEPVEFKMTIPVEHAGKTYEKLVLKMAVGRHLLAMDAVKGETRKSFALFAAMANVPIQVLEEMCMDDIQALGEAAAPLMGNSARAAIAAAAPKAPGAVSH